MPGLEQTASWTSLLPPLIAIVLAVATRKVLPSLFIGLWLGVTMLEAWNPALGLWSLVVEFAWQEVSSPWNLSVLGLMLCIGGFVELVVRSGNAEAFAVSMSRWVTNRPRAHGAVWLSGIGIFFSDSANPLILGPLFAPLFDRLKLSREKLAYLIDSTASPICVLMPITSWAAYVLSLSSRSYSELGITEPPMAAYLQSIPFQFYALASLLLVPLIGLFGIDYGPMRKADETGGSKATAAKAAEKDKEAPPTPKTARSGIIAMCTVAVVIVTVLLGTGDFPHVGLLTALTSGKSVIAVASGFICGAVVLASLLRVERVMTSRQLGRSWLRGAASMWTVLLILMLAWSLGATCGQLGTGIYVTGIVKSSVSPLLVPALVFLVGAVISFATGSAWGCFAILIPIALPLAVEVGMPLHLVLAAVLSGGVLGDHASPISDTTILSSIGAGCEHVAHVRTQLPYAATAGVAALAGFLLAAVWQSVWTLIPVVALLVTLALLFRWLSSMRRARASPV